MEEVGQLLEVFCCVMFNFKVVSIGISCNPVLRVTCLAHVIFICTDYELGQVQLSLEWKVMEKMFSQ